MTLKEISQEIVDTKEVLIRKIPNMVGNFNCQYYSNKKMKVCCFKTYEDAITFFFMEGFIKTKHDLQNSIVLSR